MKYAEGDVNSELATGVLAVIEEKDISGSPHVQAYIRKWLISETPNPCVNGRLKLKEN